MLLQRGFSGAALEAPVGYVQSGSLLLTSAAVVWTVNCGAVRLRTEGCRRLWVLDVQLSGRWTCRGGSESGADCLACWGGILFLKGFFNVFAFRTLMPIPDPQPRT